jgi:hypothetical protein
MLALEAGQHPHVITRPCHDWRDVERWARVLSAQGFVPVRINGVRFEVRNNVIKFPARSNVVPIFGCDIRGPGT